MPRVLLPLIRKLCKRISRAYKLPQCHNLWKSYHKRLRGAIEKPCLLRFRHSKTRSHTMKTNSRITRISCSLRDRTMMRRSRSLRIVSKKINIRAQLRNMHLNFMRNLNPSILKPNFKFSLKRMMISRKKQTDFNK
jgi:hypothetical protein